MAEFDRGEWDQRAAERNAAPWERDYLYAGRETFGDNCRCGYAPDACRCPIDGQPVLDLEGES